MRRKDVKVKTIVTALSAGMIVSGSAMAASSDIDAKIANLQQQVQQLQAQVNAGNSGSTASSGGSSSGNVAFVRYDSNFSQKMLNNQDSGVNRELTILQSRQSGQLQSNAIYLGGKGELGAQYTRLSSASGYPTSNSTAIDLPYANVIFTSTIGDWVTGYANVAVTNPITNDVVMPDAYFVLGDLAKMPFYFWGGVKAVDFGNFDMVNTYVPTLTRAAFAASGGQLGFGFHQYGVTATLTALNGTTLGSNNTSNVGSVKQISNFAANASYNMTVNQNFGWYIGSGYINGTGFNGNASSANPKRVGAWTANVGMNIAGLDLSADFAMTTDTVKSLQSNSNLLSTTNNSSLGLYSLPFILGYQTGGNNSTITPTNAFNGGSLVKSWDVNGAYNLPVMGHDTVLFGTYSQLYQGSDNNVVQFTAGARTNVFDTVWVGLSYNYTTGKLNSLDLQNSNLVLVDATAYF